MSNINELLTVVTIPAKKLKPYSERRVSSTSDWGNATPLKRRVLAPQIKSQRLKFRKFVLSLSVKLIFIFVSCFIIYEVFLSALDFKDKFSPIQSMREVFSSVSVDKGQIRPQVFYTRIYQQNYSALSAAGLPEAATIKVPIRSGDSLINIIARSGFLLQDAENINKTLQEFKIKTSLQVNLKQGSSVEIQMTAEGLPSQVKILLDDQKVLTLIRNNSGNYDPSIVDIEKKTGERILYGSIESSFASAAVKSGMSYDLVDELVDIFGDRVSFHKDFRKGDRFTVIYQEHEVVDSKKSNSGVILAAAFEVNGKQFNAIRFVGSDGKTRYFSEKGQVVDDSFLRYPVKFSKITSLFTTARFHPVLKVKRPHNGVDFAAPIGKPVRSVGDGIIEFSGRKGGHGNIVEIRHSDRYVTGYSHLSTISPKLKRGIKVTKGEVIGAVGMTGLATGPHLHFSLFDRGKYVDPLKSDLPKSEINVIGRELSDSYFKRALFTLEHYQSAVSSSMQSTFTK